MDPDPVDPSTGPDAWRFDAVPLDTEALVRRSRESRACAQATRAEILQGRARREILHDSAFARLMAKQETMAVIEQAKGILMAEQRCGPDEAFDLLRQASQRANVKLHVLAAQIVEYIASGTSDGNGAPRHPGRDAVPVAGKQDAVTCRVMLVSCAAAPAANLTASVAELPSDSRTW